MYGTYGKLRDVVKSYEVGGVNEGLPTRADFVDTFDETGFPGSGSAWP